MERCGQMDSAGPSSTAHPLKRIAAIIFLLASCAFPALTQTTSVTEQAKQLLTAEHWQELAALLQSGHEPSADLDFYYGTALAHLGRWQEAQVAFEAGRRLEPRDKRFPIELAGVAFKQKQYPAAS